MMGVIGLRKGEKEIIFLGQVCHECAKKPLRYVANLNYVNSAVYFSNKLTNQMQQFLKLITWHLLVCTAQHVSGVLTPIIRNSTTAVAASGFTVGAWW